MRNSFVGTAEYVSPEVCFGLAPAPAPLLHVTAGGPLTQLVLVIHFVFAMLMRQVLQDQNTTKACDIWALGCILFSLLCGRTPFQSASEYLTFQCILHHCDGSEPLKYPDTIPPLAQDLIGALLQPVPGERLGAGEDGQPGDFAALKRHPFFTVSSERAVAKWTVVPRNKSATNIMNDNSYSLLALLRASPGANCRTRSRPTCPTPRTSPPQSTCRTAPTTTGCLRGRPHPFAPRPETATRRPSSPRPRRCGGRAALVSRGPARHHSTAVRHQGAIIMTDLFFCFRRSGSEWNCKAPHGRRNTSVFRFNMEAQGAIDDEKYIINSHIHLSRIDHFIPLLIINGRVCFRSTAS